MARCLRFRQFSFRSERNVLCRMLRNMWSIQTLFILRKLRVLFSHALNTHDSTSTMKLASEQGTRIFASLALYWGFPYRLQNTSQAPSLVPLALAMPNTIFFGGCAQNESIQGFHFPLPTWTRGRPRQKVVEPGVGGSSFGVGGVGNPPLEGGHEF